jgi:hypothetical protein
MNDERGTITHPVMHQGPIEEHDDLVLNRQFFTYVDDVGYVAGSLLSVAFTVDAPAARVWPVFSDFNLWQNGYGYYYSAVAGEHEGRILRLALEPDTSNGNEYLVERVIPEHTIVMSQPVTADGAGGYPGAGGVSPGYHVFTLTERPGSTFATVMMQHAAIMAPPPVPPELTAEEVLASWREMVADGLPKWRDVFVPTLKQLVADSGP